MRLLHGLGSHGGAVELKEAAPVVDRRLGPQRLDQLDPFPEPPYAALRGHLELGVVVVPAQSHAEDRPAVAHVVQRGHLVGDVDGVVDGQDDHRDTKSDRRGDGGRVGQHHHRVEAEDVIQRVFSHP